MDYPAVTRRTSSTVVRPRLAASKPASSKGIYLRKVAVSSTMGVGVRVDQATLAA